MPTSIDVPDELGAEADYDLMKNTYTRLSVTAQSTCRKSRASTRLILRGDDVPDQRHGFDGLEMRDHDRVCWTGHDVEHRSAGLAFPYVHSQLRAAQVDAVDGHLETARRALSQRRNQDDFLSPVDLCLNS
ncbi:hypothetical protein GCM10027290_54110 [Micromonospora sonneratiae]